MPRRKRPKSAPPTRSMSNADASSTRSRTDDAIEQFASALRATEERERAEQARRDAERAHADSLATAREDLERAIEQARTARRTGRGTAEADAVWRSAKARVIELETGTPPEWAPGDTVDPPEPETVPDPGVDGDPEAAVDGTVDSGPDDGGVRPTDS